MDSMPLTALDFTKLRAMEFFVLSSYSILENDDGEFLIGISAELPPDTECPTFFYDGGAHGLLLKNSRTLVLCDFINPGARKGLSGCSEVTVAEMPEDAAGDDGAEIKTAYKAAVVSLSGIEKLSERLAEHHHISLEAKG